MLHSGAGTSAFQSLGKGGVICEKIAALFLSFLAVLVVLPVVFFVYRLDHGEKKSWRICFSRRLGKEPGCRLEACAQISNPVLLCGGASGFAGVFCHVLEFREAYRGVLLGQLLVGVPAAWGFARYRFRGRKLLFTLYIILMMMPFQVMMLSNYLVLDRLGLLDSLLGIILPAVFSTFRYLSCTGSLRGFRKCLWRQPPGWRGRASAFVRVGLPLGSPGVVSAMVLGFLEYWNLIEQPMAFLKTMENWPLSLFLPNIGAEQAAFASTVR